MLERAEDPRGENSFWDVLVVRRTGQWFGFRAPWRSLQRVTTLLSLFFLISAVASTGWLLARWRLHAAESAVASLRLRIQSLEASARPVESAPPATDVPTRATWLPGLDGQQVSSASLEVNGLQVAFDGTRRELTLRFRLKRTPPVQGGVKLYWVLLLHGPQGVMSLPPAMASQSGEALLFHRGQAVDDLRLSRDVTARFGVGTWIELAGAEPVFSTLLIYDDKGSLLVKNRQEIQLKRAG